MPRGLRSSPLIAVNVDSDGALDAIERDGEGWIAAHGRESLVTTLAAAPASRIEPSGWLLFWQGWAVQFDDLVRARERWLAAEARFAADADGIGLLLANCGLVQCTMLDNQDMADFARRAADVREHALLPELRPLLRLFQTAARLAACYETAADPSFMIADVERAFAGLGRSELDVEARVRAATAAMGVLGQALDTARMLDFTSAARRLLEHPGVGSYSKALWCLWHAAVRCFDSGDATFERDVAEALNQARRHGHAVLAGRALQAHAAWLLASRQVEPARALLAQARDELMPGCARDYALLHFLQSRVALLGGEYAAAESHMEICLQKSAEAHEPPMGGYLLQRAHVMLARGRLDDARAVYEEAAAASCGEQLAPCLCQLHLVRALAALDAGRHTEACRELEQGFAQARSIDWIHFFRPLPKVAARVCEAALEFDVDADFARRVLRERALEPEDLGCHRWPWPIGIRAMGGFTLQRDGEPLRLGRKAPSRVIDFLKLLVALGGRHVDSARLAAALWPQAEGDADQNALRVTLLRARRLLGDDALLVHDGRVSFNERKVWLDTWALEHVAGRIETLLAAGSPDAKLDGELERRRRQLLHLYRGHFLDDDVFGWALPLRDRLRARFLRTVEALGSRLERGGALDQAAALYSASIEQDNLAEDLYQRLMECHLARGERAQAIAAYRRCRDLLAGALGVKPSPKTEALRARSQE